MTTPRDPIYARHRYPAEIISYAIWLDFRFPLSLRGIVKFVECRMTKGAEGGVPAVDRRYYGAIATPVTSAQVVNGWLRSRAPD
jgi:putative transposase